MDSKVKKSLWVVLKTDRIRQPQTVLSQGTVQWMLIAQSFHGCGDVLAAGSAGPVMSPSSSIPLYTIRAFGGMETPQRERKARIDTS